MIIISSWKNENKEKYLSIWMHSWLFMTQRNVAAARTVRAIVATAQTNRHNDDDDDKWNWSWKKHERKKNDNIN